MFRLRFVFVLGRKACVFFVVAYLLLQLILIVTADMRPDRVFGFRMFNEASSTKLELYRAVRRRGRERLLKIEEGSWQARGPQGALQRFSWTDRVRYNPLMRTGEFVHSPYGLDAQLFRLQAALDDVVRHIPDDGETVALVAQVETKKNGVVGPPVRLEARRP
ncbi:MAG: hypothetical protein QM756_22225 [Polyangiaceae bacterium]